MNAKHTPGPWEIVPVQREGHVHIIRAQGKNRVHEFIEVGSNGGWQEQVANARLIAAAPDLLEALTALHTRGTTADTFCWCHPEYERAEMHQDACLNARAALRKATGEGE